MSNKYSQAFITCCPPNCTDYTHNHVTLETTEGVDMAWHLEGNEVVIDRWNNGGEPIPFDQDTFDAIWPGWMMDCVKEPK